LFKWLFNSADIYAKNSTWKDFAALKLCLFAVGLAVGVWIVPEARMTTFWIAVVIFIITYIPLMIKLIKVMKKNKS